jgi:hypothetical protein
VSDIDPNSEMMEALDDAWTKHFAHNYNAMPGRKLFYKFARYLRYEFEDEDIIKEIDTVIPNHFGDFLDYLVGR